MSASKAARIGSEAKISRQQGLNGWVGRVVPPPFFCLHASDDGELFYATWLWSCPENVQFRATLNHSGRDVVLCSTVPSASAPGLPGVPSGHNVYILKSLLQKAVRRGNAELAVKAAYNLLQCDANEFLRRFPIIVIEDASLHASFAVAVWCMAAFSKDWRPNLAVVRFLLASVETVARSPLFDVTRRSLAVLSDEQLVERHRGDARALALLLALKVRLAFGGMGHDMGMLRYAVNIWSERLAALRAAIGDAGAVAAWSAGAIGAAATTTAPVVVVGEEEEASVGEEDKGRAEAGAETKAGRAAEVEETVTKESKETLAQLRPLACALVAELESVLARELPVAPIRPSECVWAAADFHCTNIIQRFLDSYPDFQIDEATLKRLIWLFSSRVNARQRVGAVGEFEATTESDAALWARIELRVAKLAREILFQTFKAATRELPRP